MNAFLDRLTLNTRLLTLAGIGLVSSACIAGAALYGLQGVGSAERLLAEDALPSQLLIGKINDGADNLRIRQLQVVMAQRQGDGAGNMPPIKQKIDELLGQSKDYEGRIDNDEERKLHAALSQALREFTAVVEESEKNVRSGDATKVEAATFAATDTGAKTFDALGNAIDALIQYNNGAVDTAHAEARSAEHTAQWLLGVILALAALSLATISTLLTRHLKRQIGGEPVTAMEVARSVAKGDLSVQVPVRPGDTHSLLSSLADMQANLRSVVSDVRSNAEGVATASAQIAQGNADLSSRTEHQASELQETAASMEELGTTVEHNADSASQANTLAADATAVAREGGEVVGRTVETMKAIQESSHRIADIISVIDGIAFQTNILALNAAVEAARAGEQGRGFAVVASEVRNLAQRSAEAAKEIKTLIGASVERVERGTVLVDQAGSTMGKIVESIERVGKLMVEISAASTAQSGGVRTVGQAMSRMDQATQQNAALVEESAAAAESLKVQAERLVQTVAVFRLASTDRPLTIH